MRNLKELPKSMKESEVLPLPAYLNLVRTETNVRNLLSLDSKASRFVSVSWNMLLSLLKIRGEFHSFWSSSDGHESFEDAKNKCYVSEFCHRTNYNDCYKLIITALFTLWTRCAEIPFKMRLIYFFAPSAAKKTLNAHRHAYFWNVGFVVAVIKAGKIGTFVEYAVRRGQIGSSWVRPPTFYLTTHRLLLPPPSNLTPHPTYLPTLSQR